MREFGLGQSMPRVEDARLLRGVGTYTDDIVPANVVHAVILRSPYAHADIGSIDTSQASRMPGVIAVLTGADAEADGLGRVPVTVKRHSRDGSPMFEPPYRVLALDRVRRVGEGVAVVVAETKHQAKDAAEAIIVDYQPLPVVTGTAAVAAGGQPALWDEAPGNETFFFEAGDRDAVETAFATAAHVAVADYVISRVTAAPMEPRTALGVYDPVAQSYTLWAGLQQPHMVKGQLAKDFLRIDRNKIRVIAPEVGGGFGMKGIGQLEPPIVLWAAKRTGRPVKWIAERSESFLSDDHARDNVTRAELALDENGKFLALRVRATANVGAYIAPFGAHCPTNNLGSLAGVYTTGAIHVEAVGVYSNSNCTSPYRGAGRPEAAFAIERAIDVAAREMGIDRAELRRRNLIQPDAMPYQTALTFKYDSGDFPRGMAQATETADWQGFEARRVEAQTRGKLRGIGIANAIEQAGAFMEESAEIRFEPDGTVILVTGSANHGQGHETMYAQMINEFLGLDPARVRLVEGDTDAVSHGVGTFGSRSASVGGAAMALAAEKIIAKGRKLAAHMLEAAEDDVEFDDGIFVVAGTDRQVDLDAVAAAAHSVLAIPSGMEPGLHERAVFVPPAPTFPNGCHVCEVEIDPGTGALEVVSYVVTDDVGQIVNPLLVKGQIHGGVAQGLGQVLFEEICYDDEGQLLTASFMDYAMPRASDMPRTFTITTNSVPSTTNPLGIKGAGEAGTVGALPALLSAVLDALSVFGIRDIDMPVTPERIWRAISTAT